MEQDLSGSDEQMSLENGYLALKNHTADFELWSAELHPQVFIFRLEVGTDKRKVNTQYLCRLKVS